MREVDEALSAIEEQILRHLDELVAARKKKIQGMPPKRRLRLVKGDT